MKLAHATVKSDLILVLNGDSFIDVDLREFVAFHRTQRPAASLVLAHVADTRRFGRVQLKPDGWVSSFEEKGSHVGPGMINAGVYLLESKVLESIPSGRAVSLEREVLPSLINNQLSGFPCQGKFIDIGTPETYAAAETFFSESRNAAIGG